MAKNTSNLFQIDNDDDNPCCSNPMPLLNMESEWVCANCGLVLAVELSNNERRAYSPEEISNRKRTEPTWRCFGNRTVIGQFLTDARGNHLHPQKRALFARLNKIQGSLITSLERNYWESRPKLVSIANRLALPDFIAETAWKLYRIAAKKKLTMGRSIEGFVAASIYAAIRVHEFPRLLEEVVEVSMVPVRTVHKSLALIVQLILPELGLKYRPIRAEKLIFRFGNELNVSMKLQQQARTLLWSAQKQGMARIGKDPKGLAAAALYIVAKDTEEKRTQSLIASIARITEVTLRTRAKQIQKFVIPSIS